MLLLRPVCARLWHCPGFGHCLQDGRCAGRPLAGPLPGRIASAFAKVGDSIHLVGGYVKSGFLVSGMRRPCGFETEWLRERGVWLLRWMGRGEGQPVVNSGVERFRLGVAFGQTEQLDADGSVVLVVVEDGAGRA